MRSQASRSISQSDCAARIPRHPPPPGAEQIARLGYLDAVIKETACLHPVVPIVVRQLETDHAVGSAALPAGCIAAPCIYLVHR